MLWLSIKKSVDFLILSLSAKCEFIPVIVFLILKKTRIVLAMGSDEGSLTSLAHGLNH